MATSIATLDGGRTSIDDALLEQLGTTMRGDVLKPGDPGYADKPVYNAMHQRASRAHREVYGDRRCGRRRQVRPPAGVSSLPSAVAATPWRVTRVVTGGMVIDLTRMRGVEVDPDAGIARVQGGALWGDVDRETQAFGLVVPGGVVSETGVAGLTLGGGEGWVRRKYGLTIDSLLSARVVCADGSVRTASPTSEPDLFWALRGGGGNFGIVTSFEFRAHPLGPIVAFAGVFYPVADAAADPSPLARLLCRTHPMRSRRLRWRSPCRPPRTCLQPIHNQACLIIGGVYAGNARRGHEGDAAAARVGNPVGRHLAADAVRGRADRRSIRSSRWASSRATGRLRISRGCRRGDPRHRRPGRTSDHRRSRSS